jgi:beta-lactamase class D
MNENDSRKPMSSHYFSPLDEKDEFCPAFKKGRLNFLLLFVILICPFQLIKVSASVSPNDSIKLMLNQLIDQWHLDAAEANHAAYIGAMDINGTFIGTDATENWNASDFSKWSKPYFERKRTWKFIMVTRNIFLSDEKTVAWFDELLDTQMGLCRGSGVLQKKNGVWKIEQYVLSAAIPNKTMSQVTLDKKGIDSILIPYLKNGIKNTDRSMGLKSVFDQNEMDGTILIFDPETGEKIGYNPAQWDSGYLPASTFKIPNSLIGLEAGVIDTGHLFKWDVKKRRFPQWEKDLTLTEAFRVSCVPCYQEIARMIGPERMKAYLEKINYPGMDVNQGNIDLFWLEGNSRITPRQQLEFLKNLYDEKLPLRQSTMQAIKAIMVNETTPEYTLSGKTGWAIRNGNNYGWFVGWIETRGKVFFIATHVEPKNQEKVDDFAMARKRVTMEALRYLKILE